MKEVKITIIGETNTNTVREFAGEACIDNAIKYLDGLASVKEKPEEEVNDIVTEEASGVGEPEEDKKKEDSSHE